MSQPPTANRPAPAAADTSVSAIPASVHLVLVFVQLLFAGFAVVGKLVLEHLPPLAVAGLRVLGATPLLFLVAARSGRVMPPRRDLPLLVLLGLLGVTANQVLFVFGLQHTSATNASILMLSIPVFTVAVAAAVDRARPAAAQIGGVALAIAGALALLHPGRMSLAARTTVGNALILANCLAFALFLVLQRPMLRRLGWSTVLAWSFLFGGLAVIPFAWLDLATLPWRHVGAGVWLGVVYIVFVATLLGYGLNSWAMHRSSAALVATYTTAQPLFAAGLAAVFLGERLGWQEVVGFALIAAGLALVTRAPAVEAAA